MVRISVPSFLFITAAHMIRCHDLEHLAMPARAASSTSWALNICWRDSSFKLFELVVRVLQLLDVLCTIRRMEPKPPRWLADGALEFVLEAGGRDMQISYSKLGLVGLHRQARKQVQGRPLECVVCGSDEEGKREWMVWRTRRIVVVLGVGRHLRQERGEFLFFEK